ncbi:MAG: arylsulfatase [Acidobacteria bacterium]|nr:arylsulfatase [Acidobacteriota bacterium]
MKSCLRILLLLALALPTLADRVTTMAMAQRPPNIVFILADDLGWGDLGSYGNTKIRTPQLDRMAREGMRFTQFYSGSPVCAPSRCVLMTGKHGGHAYIRDNKEYQPEGQEPIPASEVTIAELLKAKGYATGGFGKWGLGFVDSTGSPDAQGFDLFYGYNCQREAHNFYPDHLWRNRERVTLEGNTRGVTGKHYSHDLIEAEALQFIRTNKDKPFFAYVPFTIPHVALQVPEDSLREYDGAFPDDPPSAAQGSYVACEKPRATYAAMVTRMDRSVGRIFALLKELKLDENTLVVFTSDNGGAFGTVTKDFEFLPGRMGGLDYVFFGSTGKFRAFKGSVYEGGIRVPFIARWPKQIKAGSVNEMPGVFYDVMATLCDVAGVKAPATDGVSLLPTLTGKGKQRRHEFLFWDFGGYGGQQAVRMGEWKGLRRNLHRSVSVIELYDLKNDVSEARDVAAQHPDIVKRIEAVMTREHQPSVLFPLRALDVAKK